MDAAHIVIGICVIVISAFAFFAPERYMFLFPAIFFLASLLYLITGIFYIRMYPRNRKKKASGVGYIIMAAVTISFCIISAVTVYRNY